MSNTGTASLAFQSTLITIHISGSTVGKQRSGAQGNLFFWPECWPEEETSAAVLLDTGFLGSSLSSSICWDGPQIPRCSCILLIVISLFKFTRIKPHYSHLYCCTVHLVDSLLITNYHTTNNALIVCHLFLNHFFKTLSLLLHVSIAYRLSSSGIREHI